MSFVIESLLAGVAAPLVVAGLVTWGGRRWVGGFFAEHGLVAVSLSAGFLGALLGWTWTRWVPASSWQWLPLLLAAAAGAALLGHTKSAGWFRELLYTCFAAVAAWLLIPNWDAIQEQRLAYVCVAIVLIGGNSLLVHDTASRTATWLLGGSWFVTLCLAALVLVVSGNLKFGQQAAAGGFAVLGFSLAAWGGIRRPTLAAAAPWLSVLLVGLLINGWLGHFSDLPAITFALPLAIPFLVWLQSRVLTTSRRTGPAGTAAVVVIAAVVAAATLGIVHWVDPTWWQLH